MIAGNNNRSWTARLRTAGCLVEVRSETEALHLAVVGAAGEPPVDARSDRPADVTLSMEASRNKFDTRGFELVTRGVWANGAGDVVVEDVGGSGFSQLWSVADDGLRVRTRWSPSARANAASVLLPARFRALQSQVLLHYPVLWWAGVQGRSPVHVSVVEVDGVAVLLGGPGGVGKSTLVARELSSGSTATCDNLAVSAGQFAYGVCEPLRLAGSGSGPRTTHGRRETSWPGRVSSLTPDLVVVVRRGDGTGPAVVPISAERAQRVLVAGTYAAGELQRFWPLAAVMGLATGRGPVHPPVARVAEALTERLPCFELRVGGRADSRLMTLLYEQLLAAHRRPPRDLARPPRQRPVEQPDRQPAPAPVQQPVQQPVQLPDREGVAS
jgi:hypothetical protein